jgi:hypothetical protein
MLTETQFDNLVELMETKGIDIVNLEDILNGETINSVVNGTVVISNMVVVNEVVNFQEITDIPVSKADFDLFDYTLYLQVKLISNDNPFIYRERQLIRLSDKMELEEIIKKNKELLAERNSARSKEQYISAMKEKYVSTYNDETAEILESLEEYFDSILLKPESANGKVNRPSPIMHSVNVISELLKDLEK